MIGLALAVTLAGYRSEAVENGEQERPRLKIAVMIAAQDVFSRRAAGLIEHLGAQRIGRESGFEMVYLEEARGLPGSSRSLESYQAALAKLKQGQADYENLVLDKAVRELSAAAELFEKVPVELLREDMHGYVSALTFLGAAHILTGDLPAGRAAFCRLLVGDRRVKLNKTLFPPSMVETFEGVRQEVLQGPVGSMSVVSVPSHAKVYVDRVFRGMSPCTVDSLPAGRHLVVLRKAGHQSWGQAVSVEEGGEQQVRSMLKVLPGVKETVEVAQAVAVEIEEDEPLDADLQERLKQSGLERLILGSLLQRGQGLAYTLCFYEVSSGQVMHFHEGVFQEGSADFAKHVDSVFSYLLTGRKDLLKTTEAVGWGDDGFRLKDEDRFDGEETTPVYQTWWFWTAIGVGAGAAALAVVLLLPGSDEPQSQILLEF